MPEVAGQPTSWREQLLLRTMRAMILTMLAGSAVMGVVGYARPAMLGLAAISLLVAGALYVSLRTGFPGGQRRAWGLVGVVLFMALGGYAVVSFIAGPPTLLVMGLMLTGLLIGKRAMWTVTLVSAVLLAVIGWAMVTGLIPAPDPMLVSMTSGRAWLRTVSISFLIFIIVGGLILDVMDRLEQALEQARAETRLREQAERDRAEAEVAAVEARQLQTIGRLAAGIAHDFNNNLTVIMGAAELIGQGQDQSARNAALLKEIIESSTRSADLTRQLLAYSRKAQMVLTPTDLNRLIEGAVGLLRRSTDPRIEVVARLHAGTLIVEADATLLQNAIMNLLINARDAMPKGGQLVVGTALHEIGAADSSRAVLPAGRYVMVEVLDTGTGITPELLPNIFEPFVTTKPVGKGTGLGLAAVAGTIKAHQGTISVESELGYGTAFRVLLPLAASAEHPLPVPALAPVRGAGHLLVVDDDLAVRSTAEAALKSLGYQVTVAEHGEAAVALVRASPARFDLVLLDLRMPKLDGAATFEQLRQLVPSLKVVLWSGYGEADVNLLLQRGAAAFVQKPYRLLELSQTIAIALAGQGSAAQVAAGPSVAAGHGPGSA